MRTSKGLARIHRVVRAKEGDGNGADCPLAEGKEVDDSNWTRERGKLKARTDKEGSNLEQKTSQRIDGPDKCCHKMDNKLK